MCRECGESNHTLSDHFFDFPEHTTRVYICQGCNSIVTEKQPKINGRIAYNLPITYCPSLRPDYRKEEIKSSLHLPAESYELYRKAILSYNNGLNEACFVYVIKLINSALDNLIDQKFRHDAEVRVRLKESPLLSKIEDIKLGGEEYAEKMLKTVLSRIVMEYEKRNLVYDESGRDILLKGITASEKLLLKAFIFPGYDSYNDQDIVSEFDQYLGESGSITITEN